MLIIVIILLVLLVKANRKISDLKFENRENEGIIDSLHEETKYLRSLANGMADGKAEEVKALEKELAATKELQRQWFYKFREYEALYRELRNAVMDRFGLRYDEVVMMVNREEIKEELKKELKK